MASGCLELLCPRTARLRTFLLKAKSVLSSPSLKKEFQDSNPLFEAKHVTITCA